MLEKGLSILIKSFERKDALERLLQSVREFFPGCSVLIFDDSRRKPDLQLQGNESLHHCHTHDVGLSAGRNWLVENCTTTHFLLCDDDTVIVESLSSKQLINKLDRARYDILGGTVLGIEGWKGSFRRHEDRLVHLLNERNKNGYFDFIPNFFVADTNQIRGILWDESLKVCEHTEFFWRAKVNCEIDPNLKSANCRDRNHYYSGFRGRIKEFQKLEKSKIGVDAYDFVDPLNIKALAVVKATLADHPQGYMDEFNRRLGDNNSHSIDWVWEADVLKGDIPWERYNLVISNFTWIGPRESPPTMRCVYLNDDLHWNANNDTRDELIEVANASDLILSPYGQHANKIPEYIASHGKFRNLPYALPWWFEPRPWAGRKNKAAMSGGYHHEIYPLRTEITKECETGILNDEIEWLGNHPGWEHRSGSQLNLQGKVCIMVERIYGGYRKHLDMAGIQTFQTFHTLWRSIWRCLR